MKVVLLAGGLGTRMREETEFKPKPMVEIGGKPVLWHIMKNFDSYGYRDFVILTGYRSQTIKEYFFNFRLFNDDFTLSLGQPDSICFHGESTEKDWKITIIDTGLDTPTGGRISLARDFLGSSPFICTYGDGLASVNVNDLVLQHHNSGKLATVTVTRPVSRFGVVETEGETVLGFREKPEIDSLVSIGYFVFENEIFSYLTEDSILEHNALPRVASDGKMGAFVHSGFWQPLDTFREYQTFNSLWEAGTAPWKTWE